MTADLLVGFHELDAVLLGELAAGRLINVRTYSELVPDVPIRLGVFVRNRAGPDHSYSQRCRSSGIMQYSSRRSAPFRAILPIVLTCRFSIAAARSTCARCFCLLPVSLSLP